MYRRLYQKKCSKEGWPLIWGWICWQIWTGVNDLGLNLQANVNRSYQNCGLEKWGCLPWGGLSLQSFTALGTFHVTKTKTSEKLGLHFFFNDLLSFMAAAALVLITDQCMTSAAASHHANGLFLALGSKNTQKVKKRMLLNQTKHYRMWIFKEILFFKDTYNTKTNKSLIF